MTKTDDIAICTGQLPYTWYGQQYSAAGTYNTTIPSITGGCDTAATLNLTVNNLLTKTDDITICTAQLPYTWYGQQYNAAGTYNTTVPSTTGGCDTAATLNLVVSTLIPKTDNITICTAQLPYTWYGQQYNAAGTYNTTVPSTTGGCDTAATLNLVVSTLIPKTDNITICTAQLPYTWYGQQYNAAGTYNTTVPSTTGGCDTAATLNLVVSTLIPKTDNITICTAQLPYTWYGQQYNAAGTYNTTVPSTTGGCDTAATLNLVVSTLIPKTDNITICTAQLPYTWYGQQYNAAGTYNTTVPSTTGGCDTAATLNLTVNNLLTKTNDITISTAQLPYTWYGQQYNAAGTYNTTVPSTTGGCDTAATLNLTVNNLLTKTHDITIPTAQLPYTWYGQQYNAAGTYNTTVPSTTGGCDTAATLNLTVNGLITKTDNMTICTTQLPYTWYGQQYNAGGTYNTMVASTTGGCDTAAILNLTVKNLRTKTNNITICTA